jgi:aryl-alcohol dehydrogenase-like predicted oxidoreductase
MSTTRTNTTLSLGTANFGNPYGLGGHGKKLGLSQVSQILRMANREGFSHLDTASSYENSEQIIGDLIQENDNWLVTTKLMPNECSDAKSIVRAVKKSLGRTKQSQFWSVLLHDSKVLFEVGSTEVQRGLNEIVESGLAQHVGISAYSESEIIQAKDRIPMLSVFQIPENVCDRRLSMSSNLLALASDDNHIFVRSIFLQGLLLMNPTSFPEKVASAASKINELQAFCEKLKITVLELCVGYAKSLVWSSGLIFGVTSEHQVREISNAFNCSIDVDYSKVPKLNDWLLDPRNWS